MPRRMIDPKIWFNEKVASLPDAGRLLFIGIFSSADDDGRLKASPKYLKAIIFPYDQDKTIEQVKELRDKCVASRLIRVYSKNSREYLDIPGWHEHQRIRKDRYTQSELPSFDEADNIPVATEPSDNHVPTIEHPNANHVATAGVHSLGEGRGVKSSLVQSKGILPQEESRASLGEVATTTKPKSRLKPYQQETGVFLDLVEKEEGTKLLSRPKLMNIARPMFRIEGTTPDTLLEFYRWLKQNDSFLRNKAPPQIILGMPDRYPSWLAGKLKPSVERETGESKGQRDKVHRPEDFRVGPW